MSKPDFKIELSEEAYDDLVDIQNYTYAAFGKQQWTNYKTKIDKAFLTLLQNPDIGHDRSDLPEPYRALSIGSHMAVYRLEHGVIFIVRILHQRMNIQFFEFSKTD